MDKISWVAALVFLTVGCASVDSIYKNYEQMVNIKDGVDAQEAKIIAQKTILSAEEKRDYRITAPDIKTNAQALKYPDHWFVVFGHNWFSPMSTDPMAKTYTELRDAQYLVVIDKTDGRIQFAGEWYVKREEDFDWVFDLQGYKKKDPLALPPGVESSK